MTAGEGLDGEQGDAVVPDAAPVTEEARLPVPDEIEIEQAADRRKT